MNVIQLHKQMIYAKDLEKGVAYHIENSGIVIDSPVDPDVFKLGKFHTCNFHIQFGAVVHFDMCLFDTCNVYLNANGASFENCTFQGFGEIKVRFWDYEGADSQVFKGGSIEHYTIYGQAEHYEVDYFGNYTGYVSRVVFDGTDLHEVTFKGGFQLAVFTGQSACDFDATDAFFSNSNAVIFRQNRLFAYAVKLKDNQIAYGSETPESVKAFLLFQLRTTA